MTEAKPREFKFVGGPSRKRRRRNEPKPASHKMTRATERQSNVEAPKKHEATEARPVSHHSQPSSIDGPAKEQQTAEYSVPQESSGISEDSDPSLIMPLYTSPNALNFFFGTADNNSSIMNPFFDPGPVFGDSSAGVGTHPQLSSFLNPDMGFSQNLLSPAMMQSIGMQSQSVNENGSPRQPFEVETTHVSGNMEDGDTGQPGEGATASEPAKAPDYTEAWKRLIARYDKEFCVLPLTHDFDANPFRQDLETGTRSELLLHCILALSYKHLDHDTGNISKEAKHHKERALQLLGDMERDPNSENFEPNLLDAVLILMTLDCATSAHGPWSSYLQRARVILEAVERLEIPHTPRLKAQVGMLVWWDVTLALTSRQGCVLSTSIIESQLTPQGAQRSSFYSISGCPEDLFRHMIQLDTYAREYELTSNMTCVTFDMGPVLAVEKGIRDWSAPEYRDHQDDGDVGIPSPASDDPEETVQYNQDLYHCAEAWRYALLLYIERVFKCSGKGKPKGESKLLGFLARKTLNNVSSCRKNLMLQKQLLLPVFLAGCETKDEFLRREAREYCDWWNEETRYDMFLTAAALLQEVWETEDPNSWWGSIIDQKTRAATGSGRQYLFG